MEAGEPTAVVDLNELRKQFGRHRAVESGTPVNFYVQIFSICEDMMEKLVIVHQFLCQRFLLYIEILPQTEKNPNHGSTLTQFPCNGTTLNTHNYGYMYTILKIKVV